MKISSLIETFTVEYQTKVYFRVEILDDGALGEGRFFSELYMLKYQSGVMAMPANGYDHAFRQHWAYLDDFPMIRANTAMDARVAVLVEIERYAASYVDRFGVILKRKI